MKYLLVGGSGSLGTTLSKELIDEERVAIYSRNYHHQEELRDKLNNPTNFRWFLGDVRDKNRLFMAMRGIDRVINCAALKGVEAGEYNPTELLEVNVIGAKNVLQAALETGAMVEFISTDKACDPLNSYGASKRLAES